jgi:hypothetical protein
MIRRVNLLISAICLVGFVFIAGAPAKEFRPFRGQGEAVWDNIFNGLFAPPANFSGEIQVTHMGRTAQRGTLFLSPPNPNTGIAPGRGSVTFTAANGDSISFNFQGKLNSLTGEGKGTFTITGGTGRFADAAGNGTFRALIDLTRSVNQPMSVKLDGRISF